MFNTSNKTFGEDSNSGQQEYESIESPGRLSLFKKQSSLMASPKEAIISEVNEDNHEYGALTEEAHVNQMQQLSLGLNKKLENIFGGTGADVLSSRPMSMKSGVFGGAGGSSNVTSPNASIVMVKTNHFDPKNCSTEAKLTRFASAQSSIEKKHRRSQTFGEGELAPKP